jgi:hypothetical protein
VVEGAKEVGRYFLLVEIQEVGAIPIGCVVTGSPEVLPSIA